MRVVNGSETKICDITLLRKCKHKAGNSREYLFDNLKQINISVGYTTSNTDEAELRN